MSDKYAPGSGPLELSHNVYEHRTSRLELADWSRAGCLTVPPSSALGTRSVVLKTRTDATFSNPPTPHHSRASCFDELFWRALSSPSSRTNLHRNALFHLFIYVYHLFNNNNIPSNHPTHINNWLVELRYRRYCQLKPPNCDLSHTEQQKTPPPRPNLPGVISVLLIFSRVNFQKGSSVGRSNCENKKPKTGTE